MRSSIPDRAESYARGDAPTCNGAWENPDWLSALQIRARRLRLPAACTGASSSSRAKSIGDHLWLQASYVYSSLRGNYDGGVNEGGYDQTWPGITGDIDYPAVWHNGYGILALDRPHRLRLDGYWATPWRLAVGLQAFVESGAPLNKMGYFNGNCGSCVFLVPRGSAGRLPTLWEANLTLSYPIVMGPTTVTLQAYFFNLFNKQIAVARNDAWARTLLPEGFRTTSTTLISHRPTPSMAR